MQTFLEADEKPDPEVLRDEYKNSLDEYQRLLCCVAETLSNCAHCATDTIMLIKWCCDLVC